jgi:RHS repeat-associated protein
MSTLLERLEYGFDRDSRRTWRRRSLTTGEDYAYGYDGLSQVVNAARGSLNLNATAIGGVAAEAEGWDYDPTGNWKGYRIEEDGAVVLDQKRVHDQGNRLTQIEGNLVDGLNPIRVDRVGRMLEVPPDAAGDWEEPLKLEWDAWSRVVLVQREDMVWTYNYDGLFRRITRSGFAGDRHTYYSDAWRPLEDRDGSAAADPNVQYFWGARHRDDLVRRDRATESDGVLNETRYVLMDYFSPAAITDESGEVKERYAFSAFGVRRILAPDFTPRGASECGLEFAFHGQFEDHESGFLNYGFRYYSPWVGRWLSKDPIMERGGKNLYAFVGNQPISKYDRLGLVDINLVPKDDDAYKYWNEYNTDKDTLSVAAHSSADSILDSNGNALSVNDLVSMIKNNKKFNACKTIKLFMCNVANPDASGISIAQQVATALNKKVEAPDGFLTIDTSKTFLPFSNVLNKEMYISSEYNPDGAPPKDRKWQIFSPKPK